MEKNTSEGLYVGKIEESVFCNRKVHNNATENT